MLRIFTFTIAVCFTLLIFWAGGWLWFATTIAMTTPQQETKTTDAIIVLTGGNGRINAGLDLLAKKSSNKLFISGVNEDVTQQDIFNSWKNPIYPKPCCVFLGYKARDTVGNANEVKDWVNKNSINSFLLVTSNYHMPRANMLIKRSLPDKEITPHPVFSDDCHSWKGRFWELTFSEYNKSLISWFRLDGQ